MARFFEAIVMAGAELSLTSSGCGGVVSREVGASGGDAAGDGSSYAGSAGSSGGYAGIGTAGSGATRGIPADSTAQWDCTGYLEGCTSTADSLYYRELTLNR